jgi:FlaA1/EpsC-like NDP-sugar epimerase
MGTRMGTRFASSDSSSKTAALSARQYLYGKRVLVTGACGTLGRRLIQRLLESYEVGSLVGLDHNESDLASLEEEYQRCRDVRFLLADMRDGAALLRETRSVDVLFHTAAYKHVHVCERSPLEAIKTNILGVHNVVQSCLENRVERLVFTSSDKAVNPTNVMGTSKLMGERIIAAAAEGSHRRASFFSTRFGNVVGSRGSVFQVFYDQIRKGGPVTLTHPDMTRFIMSPNDAVDLVVESIVLANAGDVLISKMPSIRIADLAEVMIQEYAPRFGSRPSDIEIKLIGPKAGEKLYEELMNEEETRRALELKQYYVLRPASTVHRNGDDQHYPCLINRQVDTPYNSRNAAPLSPRDIHQFLVRCGLIEVSRSSSEVLCA